MASTDELLDELVVKCKKHEDPNGERGFLKLSIRNDTLSRETDRDDRESGFAQEGVM